MQLLDIFLTGAIIGGALYLLYRAFWRKRGYCPGCDSLICPSRQTQQTPDSIKEPKGVGG